MKKIRLSPARLNKSVKVDDEDYPGLIGYRWGFHRAGGYAARVVGKQGKQKTILMHRQLLGLEAGNSTVTDHINGDGLDNRRSNIRKCKQSENMRNRKVHKNNKSGIKGVRLLKGRWWARIQVNKVPHIIGYYKTKGEAAAAYDATARALHGKFARLNGL